MGRLKGWIDDLRNWTATRVWLILIASCACGPIGFVAALYLMHKPPVIVYDTYEEDGAAVSGGQLDLISTKRDNAPCFTTVARWLWRFDPTDPLPEKDPQKRKEIHEIVSTPNSPPMIGHMGTYRLVVPLPANIEPDDHWHYQGQAIDTCGGPLSAGPRFSRDIPLRIGPEDLK
jgi:hypothetical protein